MFCRKVFWGFQKSKNTVLLLVMTEFLVGRFEISDIDSIASVPLRALETAALAVGRLDALGRSAEPGLQALLALRCSVVSAGLPPTQQLEGIIAILRADGEGGDDATRLATTLAVTLDATLSEGARRSRAGTAPTARWVAESLGEGVWDDDASRALDEVLRAIRPPHPGVLTALVAARLTAHASVLSASVLSALILHHAGSLGGTWCAVPAGTFHSSPDAALPVLAESMATAAREAALALTAATAAMPTHETRVREAHGRAAHGAIAVLHAFRRWTVLEIPATARRLRCTRPTVAAAIERLEALGLVTELTGRGRDRAWCYSALAAAMLTPRA